MPAELRVHLATALIDPAVISGSFAVVIDLLRATTTMTAALHAGAAAVIPVTEVSEAFARRDALLRSGAAPDSILLGGERGGRLIDGFDLDNSPRAYTADRVRARTVIFTTTNGTRCINLTRAAGASRIVIACLGNLRRVADACAASAIPVHILAAGHAGLPLAEDVICAGAVAATVLETLPALKPDDSTQIAIAAWRHATSRAEAGLVEALSAGDHGRNLARLGFTPDIAWCARRDWTAILPTLDESGTLRPA